MTRVETPFNSKESSCQDVAPSVDTRYGKLAVPALVGDLITDFLRRYGEWAWLEAECLRERLSPGGRVLDGGAYLGTFGIGVAQLRALGFVCFVEANPIVLPLLRQNVQRCCNVTHTIVAGCLTPPGSAASAGHADPDNLGAARFAQEASRSGRFIALPPSERTLTLTDLLTVCGPFDLIKLDLEGGEVPLLTVRGTLAAVAAADLWVECLADEAALDLAACLLSAGRPLWYYAWPAFNPANYMSAPASHLPYAYESALLLEGDMASRRAIAECALPSGCIRRSISVVEDLRKALWLTPRFSPVGWDVLSREAVVAVAVHEMADEQYDTFLKLPGRRWSSPLDRAQTEIRRLQALIASVAGVST